MSIKAISLGALLVTLLVGVTGCIGQSTTDNGLDDKMLDELLTRVMTYISQDHHDAAELIPEDISWTRVSRTKKPGYTRYVYQGNDWTVTIGLATTAESIYDVKAENHAAGIAWLGTVKDSTITEIEYTSK